MALIYYNSQLDMTKLDKTPWAVAISQKYDSPFIGQDSIDITSRYIDPTSGAYKEIRETLTGEFKFSGDNIVSGIVTSLFVNGPYYNLTNLVPLPPTSDSWYSIGLYQLNVEYSNILLNIGNLPAIYNLALAGDDLIITNSGYKVSNVNYNDVINAFAGNDKIQAGFGDDQINGGPGIDTSIYFGKAADYTVKIYPTYITVLDKIADRDGFDTLFYVEKAQFADYIVDFTKTAPVDKAVYLMYQAALGRMPDQSGFDYWTSQAETKNYSSLDLANIFSKTDEFTARFGTNPTNTAYVLKLYDNVLGRAPDTAGLNYWVGRLDAGTSKEQVLSSFALGDENLKITAPHVDNGFWLQFG